MQGQSSPSVRSQLSIGKIRDLTLTSVQVMTPTCISALRLLGFTGREGPDRQARPALNSPQSCHLCLGSASVTGMAREGEGKLKGGLLTDHLWAESRRSRQSTERNEG